MACRTWTDPIGRWEGRRREGGLGGGVWLLTGGWNGGRENQWWQRTGREMQEARCIPCLLSLIPLSPGGSPPATSPTRFSLGNPRFSSLPRACRFIAFSAEPISVGALNSVPAHSSAHTMPIGWSRGWGAKRASGAKQGTGENLIFPQFSSISLNRWYSGKTINKNVLCNCCYYYLNINNCT